MEIDIRSLVGFLGLFACAVAAGTTYIMEEDKLRRQCYYAAMVALSAFLFAATIELGLKLGGGQ